MPSRSHNPVAVALYVNAGILLAILFVLTRRSPFPDMLPAAMAQSQGPIAGGGGVYVMPAQFHAESWGCYLLDVDAQTLCTYEYDPGAQKLKLTSARDFRYDRLLKNFATSPAPWEVQQMVEQEKQMPRPPAKDSAAPKDTDQK
jgi:hypothetical protein